MHVPAPCEYNKHRSTAQLACSNNRTSCTSLQGRWIKHMVCVIHRILFVEYSSMYVYYIQYIICIERDVSTYVCMHACKYLLALHYMDVCMYKETQNIVNSVYVMDIVTCYCVMTHLKSVCFVCFDLNRMYLYHSALINWCFVLILSIQSRSN